MVFFSKQHVERAPEMSALIRKRLFPVRVEGALPAPVIAALEQAARQVYDEIGAQNATFKKVYDNYAAFASDHYLWWQAGDFSADALGIRHYRRS